MGFLTDEPMYSIGGLDFYTSSHLMVRDGNKKIRKTFRERLTWKFWESYRLVPNMVPDKTMYRLGDKIIVHPSVLHEVIKEMENK